ncbi:MAG: hypothetical protein R2854_05895 [Caldilineaceae bacterium]
MMTLSAVSASKMSVNGHNAHQEVIIVHHGQAANVEVFHHLGRVHDQFFGADGDDRSLHDFPNK